MAKKLLYSDRKQASIEMELPEFQGLFTIVSQFTRSDRGTGKMAKPAKGKAFDPKNDDTRIFNLIQLGDNKDKLYCIEIGKLNSCPGFSDVIVVEGNSMSLKDGARINSTGGEVTFAIAG